MHFQRIFRQSRVAVFRSDAAAQSRPDRPVGVPDGQFQFRSGRGSSSFKRLFKGPDQMLGVVAVLSVMIRARAFSREGRIRDAGENGGEIQSARFPEVDGLIPFQKLGSSDGLVDRMQSEFGKVSADFFCNKTQEVFYIFRFAPEELPEFRILRGHPHRTAVLMAFAHHDAAKTDQNGGGESEFLGAEERGDHDIAPGFELAVGLNPDPVAQFVQAEGLLHFRESQFPGESGVLDAGERRSPRAAVVPADQNHVRMAFRDSRRNRPDPDFRNQFDGHARFRIRIVQVVNQFRQILNGIDIVMWRR